MNEKTTIRCAYCGKENPPENSHKGKVIYRTRINGRACVREKEQDYCKDKPCAAHDQMAHEG